MVSAGVRMAEWVSQARAARAVGISPQALGKWVSKGLLVPAADKRVDMAHVRALVAQLDPARSPAARAAQARAQALADSALDGSQSDRLPVAGVVGGAVVTSLPDYQESRARREAIEADLRQLDLDTRCGDAVSRREMGDALVTVAAQVKLRLEVLPGACAARVAAESDIAVCRSILADAVREALEALVQIAEAAAGDLPAAVRAAATGG